MSEQTFTRMELEEIVAKRTAGLEARFTEALSRAQEAEGVAVKYIVKIGELEDEVKEWKARVGRRNTTITELKAECYDLHKITSESVRNCLASLVDKMMTEEGDGGK